MSALPGSFRRQPARLSREHRRPLIVCNFVFDVGHDVLSGGHAVDREAYQSWRWGSEIFSIHRAASDHSNGMPAAELLSVMAVGRANHYLVAGRSEA
jgi:hypothetical protein